MNADCIVVDKPIAGLSGIRFNKCTTLDQVLAALAACCEDNTATPAPACAVPARVLGDDGLSYLWDDLRGRAIFGVSPIVLNPTTTGNRAWAVGQSEATPVVTLTLTNPHPCRQMIVQGQVLQGLQVALGNFENAKVSSIGARSDLAVDNGSGVLTPFLSLPNSLGDTRHNALTVAPDVGSLSGAAINVDQTGIFYSTIAPGATATLRAQTTITCLDGGTGGIIAYVKLAAFGIVV